MRAIKYTELKKMYDALGPRVTCRRLTEALQQGHLKASDFSIRDLAETFMGREWVKTLNPANTGSVIYEADSAVDSTAFANITQQVIYTAILEAYQSPAFWATNAVRTISTKTRTTRIPGIGSLEGEATRVGEGMPYPAIGFAEDYVDTPPTVKHGAVVQVTKEAIFYDQTGLVLMRAGEIGNKLAMHKEKRILDMILGVATTFETGGKYRWKGVDYNVYQDGAEEGLWTNVATHALNDYTDIDEMEQLFTAMKDPVTGDPIYIDYSNLSLIVMPDRRSVARSILNATEVRNATASGAITTVFANPVLAVKLIDQTALAKSRLIANGVSASSAGKYWYLGDLSRAFAYIENWPLTVMQARDNSEAEFTQDIVLRYKVSELGACAVLNPRYILRSTGAAG